MKDQVSFSTVRLVFYQNFEFMPEEHPGFWNRSLAALGTGWKSLLTVVISVLNSWPLIALSVLGIGMIYRFIRNRRKKITLKREGV